MGRVVFDWFIDELVAFLIDQIPTRLTSFPVGNLFDFFTNIIISDVTTVLVNPLSILVDFEVLGAILAIFFGLLP